MVKIIYNVITDFKGLHIGFKIDGVWYNKYVPNKDIKKHDNNFGNLKDIWKDV